MMETATGHGAGGLRLGAACVRCTARNGEAGPAPPPLYRYRTAALAGRWRETRERALADAVAARQALADAAALDGVRWRVNGFIETA